MDSKPQVINNNLTSEYPNFLVGRKVSVITSLNGITTARVPSVIVKDEAQEFETSDGGSISSSVSDAILLIFFFSNDKEMGKGNNHGYNQNEHN